MKLNDFPIIAEIKEEYMHQRRSGRSRDEAIAALQNSYQDELTIGAEDDGLLFWVALADAQYALKELSSSVSEKALDALSQLDHPSWSIVPKDLTARRKNYSAAPMAERKTLPKSRKFRCTWKIGDTFAYLLSGNCAKEHELAGRYMLLRKVDEVEFGDGRLLPVVTLTLWDNEPLPTNSKECQRISPLKLAAGRLCFPKNKYEYRTEILFTSKKC